MTNKYKVMHWKPYAACYRIENGTHEVRDLISSDLLGFGTSALGAWSNAAEFLRVK